MKLPFDSEKFLGVFQNYNNAVFPAQIFFYILALLVIFFAFRKNRYSNSIITSILAFLWLWIGVVYHIMFFSAINKAAYLFGILNILQAILFMYYGLIKSKLSFGSKLDVWGYAGLMLIIYALLIYPVIGYFAGHVYPKSPTFGLPCPTTIFTFGILMLTEKRLPFALIIIPLLWSVIGFSAAFYLGIYEDTGLPISGITMLMFWFFGKGSITTAQLQH